jgi:hypothetical protein
MEKYKSQISMYDQEYRTASYVLSETFSIWEANMRRACQNCEKMERDRISFLREKIWLGANMSSEVLVKQDEVRFFSK